MDTVEVLTIIGLTAATIISVGAVLTKYVIPFLHVVNAAARLIDYELQHNGGTSVKDQIRYIDLNLSKLVDADSETSRLVAELTARVVDMESRVMEMEEVTKNF